MIVVDTSALIAVLIGERGFRPMEAALVQEACVIPSAVLLEFALVTSGSRSIPPKITAIFLERLLQLSNIRVADFRREEANEATRAAQLYGKGRGNKAQLNLTDLMVYATAKLLDARILCTGRDFAATDIAIHPSSRI